MLTSYMFCFDCCFGLLHSFRIHTRKKLRQKGENSIENVLKINNKCTIPQKLKVIVSSKSSAASVKSGNYSNYRNIEATPTYVSQNCIASHNKSVVSYKNQWQYDHNKRQ